MSDQAAVLFANDAFYVAFATKDIDTMDQVWAQHTPVTCLHPGWELLVGREAVMDSWQDILTSKNSPDIRCQDASASILGDTAYVVCTEVLKDKGYLIATNIFIREGNLWKMVHHQAGAIPAPQNEDETPPPPEPGSLI
ncbi:MAG: nuclear transport factor 2 family protein [Rhodospirillales bacterium]|jgi:hypothetical protein